LDHVRAKVTQKTGRVGSEDDGGQIEHPDAAEERLHAACLLADYVFGALAIGGRVNHHDLSRLVADRYEGMLGAGREVAAIACLEFEALAADFGDRLAANQID